MHIEINPRELIKKLLYLICFLLVLNILAIISKVYFGHDNIYGLIPLISFDAENSIPTLYSSFSLLFSSGLLSVIAMSRKRAGSAYFSWSGLAAIFLFLTIDEVASLHEKLTAPVRELLNTSGLLYFAWVIPYGIALIVFAIAYSRFLIRLPKNTKILFVVSGITFASGAIGFELFGGRHAELYGKGDLVFSLLYTCEELLEMLGVVIFIYALLTYIVSQFKSLTISINEARTQIAPGITNSNKENPADAQKSDADL